MIRYLTHSEIDKDKWDKAIYNSVDGNIYACSFFLDIVSPNWAALIENDYEAILPLPSKSKFSINYLFQPAFTQQLGPYLGLKEMPEILQAIPSKYKYIELNILKVDSLNTEGFNVQEKINYRLSLAQPYNLLHKQFAYNTRRNIKKCSDFLSIVNEFNDEEAISVFKKNKGSKLKGFNRENYLLLLNLTNTLKQKNLIEKRAVVNQEGIKLAYAYFTSYKKTKMFLFSALTEDGKSERAMFFLLDRFICEYSESDFILDFSGTNDLELGRFYKGFGSNIQFYYKLVKNNLPLVFKWIK